MHFGQELDRVIVFGSAARGDAGPSSDVDLMVVLKRPVAAVDWKTEWEVRALIYPLELEEDVVFDLKVVSQSDFVGDVGHGPFIEKVRAEGIEW
jgi:predicted nucleotidyltransferase